MMTCDKCKHCIEQSNKPKGARMHTVHFICTHLLDRAVNPYDSCGMWEERKGKMKIRYKDGYVDEVEEWEKN